MTTEKAIFWLSAGIAVAASLYGFDRLFLWMEEQGWIYYRKKKPSSTTMGNAFLEIHSILQPEKKHLLEVRKEEEQEDSEAGDPPHPT